VFSRRERVLLALAAIAVIAVVVIQLWGGVGGSARANEGRDIAQLNALQQRVADTDARLREITIPESEATARLLRAAQASGLATGVAITSARPRTPTKTSFGCVEHALEVQAAGSFPSIAKFMFDLEAKNANLRITRAAVTSSDDSSDTVHSAIIVAGYSPGEAKK
jgi:hypothetical protein